MSVHTVLAKLFYCILSVHSLWLTPKADTPSCCPSSVISLLQLCLCCYYCHGIGMCCSYRWNTASHSNLHFSSLLMQVLLWSLGLVLVLSPSCSQWQSVVDNWRGCNLWYCSFCLRMFKIRFWKEVTLSFAISNCWMLRACLGCVISFLYPCYSLTTEDPFGTSCLSPCQRTCKLCSCGLGREKWSFPQGCSQWGKVTWLGKLCQSLRSRRHPKCTKCLAAPLGSGLLVSRGPNPSKLLSCEE